MNLLKKHFFLIAIFSIGIFFGNIENVNAANITDINSDTYTINLEGNELNNVNALNITVDAENVEIDNSLQFSGNGASALLTSVTNPSRGRYVLSIALNQKITNGKATISGKFLTNSLLPGAKLNVVDISRDGGSSLTNSNLVTSTISFSNSKTPPPTPTPSPSPSASPSPTPNATPAPVSSPVSSSPVNIQEIVNVIVDNSNGVSAEQLTAEIEEGLNNTSDKFSVTGPSEFLIRSKGLNKYYVRVRGELDTKQFNALACYGSVRDNNFTEIDPEHLDHKGNPIERPIRNPEHLSFKEYFTFSVPKNGKKYRYDKRLTITLIPNERGQEIYRGEQTIEGDYFIHCQAYDTEDKDLITYLKSNSKQLKDLNIFDLFRYGGRLELEGKPPKTSPSLVRIILFDSVLGKDVNVGG